jgi:alpha-beta hydrolase superfamily lysophospholipase
VKKLLRRAGWVALVLFVLLNVLAYRHARSFFFYTLAGERTPPPEAMTWPDKIAVMIRGITVPKPAAHGDPGDVGLAFSTMSLPGRDGTELRAWRIPPLENAVNEPVPLALLFHGYSSEKSGLLPEARAFHDLGCEVVMTDFPGHGESPGTMTSLGIYEARDVAAVLAEVRRREPGRPVILYGHSMGGVAVLKAMAEHGATPDAAVVESVFDSLLRAIRFRFDLLSAPSWPAAEILLFWGSVQLGANGFTHDAMDYASRVDIPTLVVHGSEDNRASVAGAQRVNDVLLNPVGLLVIQGAGHVNPVLTQPDAWRTAVRGLIDHALTR